MSEELPLDVKLDPKKRVAIPMMMLPSFRTTVAVQSGTERNLLFTTWGGLGDQLCAEPTLRFALKTFKDCKISLASEQPDLFKHLKFERVFNLKNERPIIEKYLIFETINSPGDTNLTWQFFSHMITNCVDFPSLCALRCQLPIKEKEILTSSEHPGNADFLSQYITEGFVFIHAGKHWPSKTFPKEWWNSVLSTLIGAKVTPVLIGANTDDNRGTVDVDVDGCVDLRNKLTITESLWALQRCKVLLTNDSAPLHMAASKPENYGPEMKECAPWIGYVATCKHPDYISHWRYGEWSYRMKNHGTGGIWDVVDYCPNKDQDITAEYVDENLLRSWLPDPVEFADWAIERASS